MPGGVLTPEDVGAADAARVLSFLNRVENARALADTLGLSEGTEVGQRIAAAILARRAEAGPLESLDAVLAVTGVTLPRFTEIVTALSGARPAPAGARLLLTAAADSPWIGQRVGVVGQLLDLTGRGVPNAQVTCIASAGHLSARAGAVRQSGSALGLVTEPGGLVRFHLDPPLFPPLDDAAAAALQSELARLPADAATPRAAGKALAALAARYRAEANGPLRRAIDRVAAVSPGDPQGALAPWPVTPITVIALAGGVGGQAQTLTVMTLRVRNWLGGFVAALRDAVASDDRLETALKHLDRAAESGVDLSEALIRATQAFAGLERGQIATSLRDEIAGEAVNRYVARVAPTLKDSALVNSVRTAGLSRAAISSGGFAVFEAIRAAQDVEDTITPRAPGGVLDGWLDLLDSRLGRLESTALDRNALDGLRDRLRTELREELREDLAARTDDRLDRLQRQLDELSRSGPSPEVIDSLRDRLSRDLDGRLSDRLAEMETRVGASIGATRTALGSEIEQTRRDLSTRIDQKADAATVRGIERSVLELRTSQSTLVTRLNVLRPER